MGGSPNGEPPVFGGEVGVRYCRVGVSVLNVSLLPITSSNAGRLNSVNGNDAGDFITGHANEGMDPKCCCSKSLGSSACIHVLLR